MHLVRGSQIEFVPASHEDPKNPGVLKRVLATHSNLIRGQVMMVNWALLPIGKSFNAHFHEDMQEVFIILSGTATMTVDKQDHELAKGDAIVIDHREIHKMQNTCDQDVEYIVFGVSTEEGGSTVNVE
ncbi:MAG: cupin domain-containing protein [Mariniblastus sp.]